MYYIIILGVYDKYVFFLVERGRLQVTLYFIAAVIHNIWLFNLSSFNVANLLP